MSCLHPVRTCFSVTCPRLDENDGTKNSSTGEKGYLISSTKLKNLDGRTIRVLF